jgi:hypothetical protein
VEYERRGTPVASYVARLPPVARPLDRGKPRDEDTEGGSQPADKSLINRRLSLHSQPCAAMAFLADGELAEGALNRAHLLTANIRDYGTSEYSCSLRGFSDLPHGAPDVMRYGGNSSSMVRAACISAVAKPSVNRS